jgi:hypothetical protein
MQLRAVNISTAQVEVFRSTRLSSFEHLLNFVKKPLTVQLQ